jgi:hypothetical protein
VRPSDASGGVELFTLDYHAGPGLKKLAREQQPAPL